MEWQPIETAPKDGTVVLTDDGTAMFDEGHNRWAACGASGFPYSCADNGVYDLEPMVWMPLPAPLF